MLWWGLLMSSGSRNGGLWDYLWVEPALLVLCVRGHFDGWEVFNLNLSTRFQLELSFLEKLVEVL